MNPSPHTLRISPARSAAFDVLTSVAAGEYASDSLIERTAALESRDAGLAAQIVFGVLRFQAQLDFLIEHYSRRKIAELDEAVALALRTALFQLRYLDRIPPHAAVHETVELVKRVRRAASGFVNAVLRKVNRDPVIWPDIATELSCPAWLLTRWTGHFGEPEARAIAEAALHEPVPYIRSPPGSPIPDGVEIEPTAIPGCFRLLSPLRPPLRLHDISSQSLIPLLNPQPGQTYLDVCAAPGNKTVQALETRFSLAVACDVSERRLHDVPPVCHRVVLDASEPIPLARRFDRVFVDAPCSGTGTLGRNPEIKWRVQPDNFRRFRRKQIQILTNAADMLAPGGLLLYATCSLEPEENEDVLRSVLQKHPGLRCSQEIWRLPGRDEGDGFYAAILC